MHVNHRPHRNRLSIHDEWNINSLTDSTNRRVDKNCLPAHRLDFRESALLIDHRVQNDIPAHMQ